MPLISHSTAAGVTPAAQSRAVTESLRGCSPTMSVLRHDTMASCRLSGSSLLRREISGRRLEGVEGIPSLCTQRGRSHRRIGHSDTPCSGGSQVHLGQSSRRSLCARAGTSGGLSRRTCTGAASLGRVGCTESTVLQPSTHGLLRRSQRGSELAQPGVPSTGLGARSLGSKVRRSVRASVVGSELSSSSSAAIDIIGNLGLDTLTFLAATVIIVPAFKSFKASPILGFLLSGVALNELGLIRNISDVKALSELGILFLLFEMGLELSLERLRALAKFAFGIGLPQVVLTTLAFTAFELPIDNALGTRLLQFFFDAKPDLVNIRSVDEAVVIGAALSLSSSAFVLQLLAEKGEMATKTGSATLGILLLQDIAVVPLLVILPILESGDFTDDNVFPLLAAAGLKSLLGLGVLLLMGRLFLRRFFEFVAESRSSEAFVALCLLTVTGTSLITSKLGFSDSLGAFLAGALLAETNYRTQVEADIRPFRGLLLGLFFVTTGTSIDLGLLAQEWPDILALLGGLIAIKTSILTLLGPRVGLSWADSVRTGLLLSQGGEFAFVVFALANQLGVLPLELNRLLIIVVVLSMALTPLLDAMGRRLADFLEDREPVEVATGTAGGGSASLPVSEVEMTSSQGGGHGDASYQAAEPIVILGFNQQGQVLANFLSSPLAGVEGGGWPYVCFDLNPKRVRAAKSLGFPVLYGDGSRVAVLQSAGIPQPKAVLVVYSSRQRSVETVERLHHSFPSIPIFARAMDLAHMLELKQAGATDVVLESAETSLRLGSMLLQDLGVMRDDVIFLRGLMREAMFKRAEETLQKRRSGEEAQEEEGAVSGPVLKPPPLPGLLNGNVMETTPTKAAAAAAVLGVPRAEFQSALDAGEQQRDMEGLREGEGGNGAGVQSGGDRQWQQGRGGEGQGVSSWEDELSGGNQMYFSDGEDWVDPKLDCEGEFCKPEDKEEVKALPASQRKKLP